MKSFPFILLFTAAMHLRAMDRFSALSMIESGDRDGLRGPDGEISRFQISLTVCAEFGVRPEDLKTESAALSLAKRIMQIRTEKFAIVYHRPPTPTEWYLLWHRPACFAAAQQRRPIKTELDRAQRFTNLVNRKYER